MHNIRNSNSFVMFITNEGRVHFAFSYGITRIDIEPITIDFGMFEVNTFTDVSFRSF